MGEIELTKERGTDNLNNIDVFKIERKRVGKIEFGGETLDDAEDACFLISQYIGKADRVVAAMILLDNKKHIIGLHTISIGTIDSCRMNPAEVYRAAIVCGASMIFIGHNHPSGSIEPSQNDIEGTKRLVEVGKLIGIDLIDSFVVGENRGFSMRCEYGKDIWGDESIDDAYDVYDTEE